METWRSVVGYEGLYEVSDCGRVRSLDRAVPDKRAGIKHLKGRMKAQYEKGGYRAVILSKDAIATDVLVHHLVLAAFIEPCPAGYVGHHKDGNPINNRADNLEWMLLEEHNRLHNMGNTNAAKLMPAQVLRIRELAALGQVTQKQLASMFKVGQQHISAIVCRRTWKHI